MAAALHLCMTTAAPRAAALLQFSVSQGITCSNHVAVVRVSRGWPNLKRRSKKSGVKASLDATVAVAEVGTVTEVNKDTFWPIVKAAGDKTVVVDMYTQWCGPCKVIAPKYQDLSTRYDDVLFLKLDCNQENRPLAKELGIKVVPTFKILQDGNIVKEVTGAKFDDLVAAIEDARSTR